MKINSINSQLHSRKNLSQSKDSSKNAGQNPTFKSAGMTLLGASGSLMQWIENRGYFISFLIQDGLGMTAPRVWTGFHRDKEITGQYNMQEGLEVLGREGMTGPFIVGVAPAVLALAGRYCKSTNTNTRIIKRLGENLKTMISSPEFDKSIQKDSDKFKKKFIEYNIRTVYKDSVPEDNASEETIKYILEQFDKFDSKSKKTSNEALGNMLDRINSEKVKTSSNLYDVNKLNLGSGDTKQAFNMAEVLTAIKDYGNDAITRNKDFASMDASAAENIKNNFATKRLFANVTNIVVTLLGLSFIPKLYARSNVAPGAHSLALAKENNNKKEDISQTSFKGRGINSDGFFAKFGKFITKNVPEKLQGLLEYTGYNFSKTTFALLSTFGLLLPRGKRAWDRAQIDENGKRDMTEINEILLRDTISALSVVFAVPCLTKMLVRAYEDKIGFVLTNRASDGKNMFKKIWDILWPYSNLEVLSVADLNAAYGNIDSKTKLLNFSKFISDNKGDLGKVLSKSENASLIFNDKTFTLESIKNLSREEKNKKITALFEKLEISDEIIKKVMKGSGDIKNNMIAKFARGLNSLPGAVSTLIISPILLGILIPKLTYYNTRMAHARKLEKQEKQA